MSNESNHDRPSDETPLFHRGVLLVGLLLFTLWFSLHLLTTFLSSISLSINEGTRELTFLLFALGAALGAFGLGCELIMGAIVTSQARQDEDDRLAELCGRSRFQRSRKKYKRLRSSSTSLF